MEPPGEEKTIHATLSRVPSSSSRNSSSVVPHSIGSFPQQSSENPLFPNDDNGNKNKNTDSNDLNFPPVDGMNSSINGTNNQRISEITNFREYNKVKQSLQQKRISQQIEIEERRTKSILKRQEKNRKKQQQVVDLQHRLLDKRNYRFEKDKEKKKKGGGVNFRQDSLSRRALGVGNGNGAAQEQPNDTANPFDDQYDDEAGRNRDGEDDEEEEDDDRIHYAAPLEKDAYTVVALHGLFNSATVGATLILLMKFAAIFFYVVDILFSNNYINTFILEDSTTASDLASVQSTTGSGGGEEQVSPSSFTTDSWLAIPEYVDWAVRGAQFITLPFAVFLAHSDAIVAIYWFQIGYPRETFDRQRDIFPNVSAFSWRCGLYTRLLTGLALGFVSFIQIVRATRIRSLFLSLQAVIYIGVMDKVMFWLAEFGFLGQKLQRATETLDWVDPIPTSFGLGGGNQPHFCQRYLKTVIMVCIAIISWAGWAILTFYQNTGVILAENSCVQFTVDFPTTLPTLSLTSSAVSSTDTLTTLDLSMFSGTYRIGLSREEFTNVFQLYEITNQRLVYYQQWDNGELESLSLNDQDSNNNRIDTSTTLLDYSLRGRFYYCQSLADFIQGRAGAWIFTIDALSDFIQSSRPNAVDEDCPGWIARSPQTNAFRLEDVPLEGWRIWNDGADDVNNSINNNEATAGTDDATTTTTTASLITTDDITMACDECTSTVDCHYEGTCPKISRRNVGAADALCTCNALHIGSTCEYPITCTSFNVVLDDQNDLGIFSLLHRDGSYVQQQDTGNDEEYLLLSGKPIYLNVVVLNQDEVTDVTTSSTSTTGATDDVLFTLDDAIEAGYMVQYFFFATGRWHLGWSTSDDFHEQFIEDDTIHPFWDQGLLLRQVQLASSSSVTTSTSTTTSPLDGGTSLQWFQLSLLEENLQQQTSDTSSSSPSSSTELVQVSFTCLDSTTEQQDDAIATNDSICASKFLFPDDVLGCPSDFTAKLNGQASAVLPSSSSTSAVTTTVDAAAAFDGNVQTSAVLAGPESNNELELWYTLPTTIESTIVVGYELFPSSNGFPCQDPTSWTLYGCSDSATATTNDDDPTTTDVDGLPSVVCVTLDTRTEQVFTSRGGDGGVAGKTGQGKQFVIRTTPIDASVTFSIKHLRLALSNSGSPTSCDSTIQIGDVKYYGYSFCSPSFLSIAPDGCPTDLSSMIGATATITSTMTTTTDTETTTTVVMEQQNIASLFDTDLSSGLTFASNPTTIEMNFEIDATLYGYSLASTSSSSSSSAVCQPTSWTLYGCDCQGYCTLLDTQQNETFMNDNNNDYFILSQSQIQTGFTNLKLVLVGDTTTSACESVVLSNFQIYGTTSTSTEDNNCPSTF